MLPHAFKNHKIRSLDQLNFSINKFMDSKLKELKTELLYKQHYNSKSKEIVEIGVYKDEAIVTYNNDELKDVDIVQNSISENELRKESGLKYRTNYINNPDNLFVFQQVKKLENFAKRIKNTIDEKVNINLPQSFNDERLLIFYEDLKY